MPARPIKVLIALGATAGIAVGGALALDALWNGGHAVFTSDTCTVGGFDLDPSQAAVASTMVGEVTKRGLPERASVLVLAAGLQESKLTNLPPGQGDRDSVGVLQQRPSQGWGGGSAARLTDVGEATREFLDALLQVPHWQLLPLAEAVQDVQISADGSAYADQEIEAQALADALSGAKPAAISCSFAKPTKVASTATVAAQARDQLGIDTPAAAGARTMVAPGAHWQTVAWLVANADRLGIETVSYDHRQWSRSGGWQASAASAAEVTATMYQL